jgi:hypothetical protein
MIAPFGGVGNVHGDTHKLVVELRVAFGIKYYGNNRC